MRQHKPDSDGGLPSVRPSRRSVLGAGALLGGSLLLGFGLSESAPVNASAVGATGGRLNAFIGIGPDGVVTMVMPAVEMGQGAYTSMAMILAEELDVDLKQVKTEHAPPDAKDYANPVLGSQMTGGSTTMVAWYMPLRKAGASARGMIVDAAAARWRVAASTLRTHHGIVFDDANQRSLPYGALAGEAARRPVPTVPNLKPDSAFTLIGTSAKRLDTPDKVNGKAVYGIDVMLPGMKVATLTGAPVVGARLRKVDDVQARAVLGVRQILPFDDMVAVVADNMWAASQGLAALGIEWDLGPGVAIEQQHLWTALEKAAAGPAVVAKTVGDPRRRLNEGDLHESSYELPFLAHAAMETMNCTAHVTSDACEIWVGTQNVGKAVTVAAAAAGVSPDAVILHNHLIGGGFGRRLEVDGIEKAVRIARRVPGPVKVIWSREEDIRQDFLRPIYRMNVRAKVTDGRIEAWHHRVTGPAIIGRWVGQLKDGIDPDAVDGAVDPAYDFPNHLVEYVRHETPAVATSFWRGVGPNANVFAIESLFDRISKDLAVDPIDLRRSMIHSKPRARAVLDLAAEKSGWGGPLPAPAFGGRVGRGVALLAGFGSFIANVVEVEVLDDGEVRVRRVVAAADVGRIVNPDTLLAQVQGGTVFGLAAVLHGSITLEAGRIKQSNFHDYRVTRIDEMPVLEAHLVMNSEAPGGIGEPGTVAVQPAVANAVFAATGVQLTRMPIDRSLIARSAS